MKSSDFDYKLPAELIAQQPLADRAASRMLVLDRGTGDHSVFARAFLDVLAENRGVLSSVGLYRDVFEKVAAAARKLGIEQLPQLRPIRPAGHEWGDFFFVPRA